MNDHPDALELLRIANYALMHEVLPDARAEQRYTLRMIGNALGIAMRELESHGTDTEIELRGLSALYDGKACAGTSLQRNQQFSRDIRAGWFEKSTEQETRLRQHLIAVARAKLAVTYPKGLSENDNDI